MILKREGLSDEKLTKILQKKIIQTLVKIRYKMYQMTILGTTQKWSSLAGGHLIKYHHKTTTI